MSGKVELARNHEKYCLWLKAEVVDRFGTSMLPAANKIEMGPAGDRKAARDNFAFDFSSTYEKKHHHVVVDMNFDYHSPARSEMINSS